jgi:predicted enzyme related to lactoylglutathione lyase
MTAATLGRFVWHELHTKDRAKAIAFYKQLMGWEIYDGKDDHGMGPYGHCRLGGVDFAGIMKSMAPEHVPSHWLPYIAVDDVDKAAARAKELGGMVRREPMEIPTVGRFAVLADAQGATFAVFRQSTAYGAEPERPPVGMFAWDELMSSDPAAAAKFYCALFGYTVQESDMGPMGTYRVLKRGDRMTAGIMKMPPQVPQSHWMTYLHVADVDASTRNATELGAKVMVPPTDIPNIGRFSAIDDPSGAGIALFKGSM